MELITVEDCTEKIANRFELVLLEAHRCRQIARLTPKTVDPEKDKDTIVALRDIAAKTIQIEDAKEDFIQSMQNYFEVDKVESEVTPLVWADTSAPLGPVDIANDIEIDHMAEDELRHGLNALKLPLNSLNYRYHLVDGAFRNKHLLS